MMRSSNGNIFHITGPLWGDFTAQRPVKRSFDVFFALSFIQTQIRDAGDLRHHCAHYDVTVMVRLHPRSSAAVVLTKQDQQHLVCHRADSMFAPSQWETTLLCNRVSHWLGTNLKSALCHEEAIQFPIPSKYGEMIQNTNMIFMFPKW